MEPVVLRLQSVAEIFGPPPQLGLEPANLREMIVLILVSICQEKIVLEGHQDQIYSLAWSQCGRFLATVCRDGKVRIYDPRGGSTPVRLVAWFLTFFSVGCTSR
jgi:WD40 repeat protein